MIIPIRCTSCNKPVADCWEPYIEYVKNGLSEAEALDKLGLVRYCCRRMILTHVDVGQKPVPT